MKMYVLTKMREQIDQMREHILNNEQLIYFCPRLVEGSVRNINIYIYIYI